MTTSSNEKRNPQLSTPRSAALAGIAFAVSFAASLIFLRLSIPGDLTADIEWGTQSRQRVTIALILMPFAGVFFLWFVGVIRDRFGDREDRFFATVFLGSSILFLAMVFVAMAIAGALVATTGLDNSLTLSSDVALFARALMLQISNVYALRMASVLMFSLATIWLRTHLMPRWLVIITYLLATVLLFVVSLSLWVTLVFPGWVMLVSVYVLWHSHRKQTP